MDSKDIDYLGREAEKLPRFLFRGFHSLSGGGQTGLNTAQGVVPHGFLYEDSSADSADSDSSDSSHGNISVGEHFPHLSAAGPQILNLQFFLPLVPFLQGECREEWVFRAASEPAFVAVLDTSTLANRHLRVFHAPTLGCSGVKVEYLVRGPVRREDGVDYRCIAISDIRNALTCDSWPRCPARAAMPHPITENEVRDAWLVAGCFRQPEDTNDDVLLAVAAAELGRQQWGYKNLPRPWVNAVQAKVNIKFGPSVECILNRMRRVFGDLRLSKEPLANPETPHDGFPQLRLMDELLIAFSSAVPFKNQSSVEAVSGELMDTSVHHCHGSTRLKQFGKKALYANFDAMLGDSVPFLKEIVLQPPEDI